MRARIVSFLIFCGAVFIVLKLVHLQVIRFSTFRNLSDKNCIRLLTQPGARGRLLDRNGNIIVGNRLAYDVAILPDEEHLQTRTIAYVAQVLDMPQDILTGAFKSGFLAPSIPVVVAKNIDLKKALALEEARVDFPNLAILSNPVRDYPYADVACHVTGYVGEIDHWRLTKLADYGYKRKDIVGFGGIEERYDYYLRQEDGVLSVEVDHEGRFIRVMGFRPSKNGKDIELTLDLGIQKIVEDALHGRKGTVIMMNPQTGEIIAMASQPNFLPAAFIRQSGSYLTNLFSDPQAPLLNRAISGVYPAGSVFKVVVSTAGLETGKIDLGTTFLCTGSIQIGNEEFSCWSTHGPQNLLWAIAHSCNIFFYRTGLLVGAQNLAEYAKAFGLGRATGVDLPYESPGFVPSPLWKRLHRFKTWFTGDTANFAIGQGDLLVTPLQLTRMMAVFANQGKLVTPYIVKRVDRQDISASQRKAAKLQLKEKDIACVRQGLRRVVTEATGTGNVLSTLPMSVAGKTGTVQVPHGQPHAWFVGFFPYEKPRIVLTVFLEHGGSGQVSCALARQIIEAMRQADLLGGK